MAGLVTAIALPLIARHGSQPQVKAILQRNYAGNLTIIVSIVGVLALVLYAVRVARDAGNVRRRSGPGDAE